jgi:hypothetical protein
MESKVLFLNMSVDSGARALFFEAVIFICILRIHIFRHDLMFVRRCTTRRVRTSETTQDTVL